MAIPAPSRAAYWRAAPGGTIRITRGGEPGSASTIDVADDLGLRSADLAAGSLDVEESRHRLGLAFRPVGFGGETTLRKPIVFHGASYPTGERVQSDVDLTFWIPRYSHRVLSGDHLDLRAGLAAYIWTFDSRLVGSGPGGPIDERRRFTHLLPAGTLSGQFADGSWYGRGNLSAGIWGQTVAPSTSRSRRGSGSGTESS